MTSTQQLPGMRPTIARQSDHQESRLDAYQRQRHTDARHYAASAATPLAVTLAGRDIRSHRPHVESNSLLVGYGRDKSLLLWGAAFGISSLAFAMLSIRGTIPDLLSIVVANTLIASTYALLAEGISQRLAEIYTLDKHNAEQQLVQQINHRCTGSFGIKVFNPLAELPGQILHHADQAMSAAKNPQKGSICLFQG